MRWHPLARQRNKPRQSAWTEDAGWLAMGSEGPTWCQSRTAAPRPETAATRTRLPTAVLRRRDRLRRACIRPCSSSKLPLTPAPRFA